MEYKNIRQGFTLIEFLVVVLVIGILAAVAVPQYQKAVEKSKAAEALALLKAVVQAQAAYYLANGTYATRFEELDVNIPWQGGTKWNAAASGDVRSSKDWSLQLYTASQEVHLGVAVGRISGAYAGAGWMYLFSSKYDNTIPLNTIVCAERRTGSYSFTAKENGKYCNKLFNGKRVHNGSNLRVFKML